MRCGLSRLARGAVSACVWDYGGRMEFVRCFWDAVAAVDPTARELDEGAAFPLCRPARTHRLVPRGRACATYAASRSRSRRSSPASMTIGGPSSEGRVPPLPTSHRSTRIAARRWPGSWNRLSREGPAERSLSLRAPGRFEEPPSEGPRCQTTACRPTAFASGTEFMAIGDPASFRQTALPILVTLCITSNMNERRRHTQLFYL